jgi:hypothetical protein
MENALETCIGVCWWDLEVRNERHAFSTAADNCTVTLSGRVPSERDARAVEQVVLNVYGVKAVSNNLTYPLNPGVVTPPDADSIGVTHPAYSDIAPAERAPAH